MLCLCRLANRPATFLTETVPQVLHAQIDGAVADGLGPARAGRPVAPGSGDRAKDCGPVPFFTR